MTNMLASAASQDDQSQLNNNTGKPHDVLLEALRTFTHLEENEHIGAADGLSCERLMMPCDCQQTSNDGKCGDGCINRALFIECVNRTCSVGDGCGNRRFRQKQYAPFEIFKSGKKGFGVRAKEAIPADTFIIEYIGDVVTISTFLKRTKLYEAEGLPHFYNMCLKSDEYLDATKRGGLGRFINHSCKPNCQLQKWNVGKYLRVGIFSKCPIAAGEEITYDYDFVRYGSEAQPCFCGEDCCKGTIGRSMSGDNEDGADEDDESEDDCEEEDYEELASKRKTVSGIDDIQDIAKLISSSMANSDNSKRTEKSLDKLMATEDTSCLLRFINLHGPLLLGTWASTFKHNVNILKKILKVLVKLPFKTKNSLQKLKVENFVAPLADHEDMMVSAQAKQLLEVWSKLQHVFVIPKVVREVSEEPLSVSLQKQAVIADSAKSSAPASAGTLNSQKRGSYNSDIEADPKRHRMDSHGNTYRLEQNRYSHNRRSDDVNGARKLSISLEPKKEPVPSPQVELIDGVPKSQIDLIIQQAREKSLVAERLKAQALKDEALANAESQKARRQEEAAEKEKARLLQKERRLKEKESRSTVNTSDREKKSGSPVIFEISADDKQKLRDQFSSLVVKCLSRHKDGLDDFKKHARKITHLLIEKESRNSNGVVVTEETRRKIEKFIVLYIDKLKKGSQA